MTTALIIGRFQPFHRGHQRYIEYVLGKVDTAIIVIGSSQESFTNENPFTAGERTEMIRNSVSEIDRYILVPVPDVNDDKIWVEHVASLTPKFDVVFTNNPLEKKLFEKAGFRVEDVPFFEKMKYSATNIREQIRNEQDWGHLVPKGTLEIIKKIDGEERIRELG